MKTKIHTILCILFLVSGCAAEKGHILNSEQITAIEPKHIGSIFFKGRTIDLDAHLQGFPYAWPRYNGSGVDARSGKMFYIKKGSPETLMMVSFDPDQTGKVDIEKGQTISESDFSKRNWWGEAFINPQTNKPIIKADEDNKEIFNFYELDPATGLERQLSHVAYIYGHRLSDDGRLLAFTSRLEKGEMSPGEVHVLDLLTGEERVVFKDTPEYKMTWGNISWQPGNRGLLVAFNVKADRNKKNLLYIPLEPGATPRVITDTAATRSNLDPLNTWLSNDEFLYTSDEADFTGVYRTKLSGKSQLVTRKGDNVKDAAILENRGNHQLIVATGNPLHTELKLIEINSGKVTDSEDFNESIYFQDAYKNSLYVKSVSLSNPLGIAEIRVRDNRLTSSNRVSYPDDLLDKIVQCEAEKVSFETFDKLSAPSEQGTLHAYLLKPKHPLPTSEVRGLVLSFYGGLNTFDPNTSAFQILCDAGYFVLSPAPRGTEGFGEKFQNIAKGDWGGAETLDDFAAGKYLAKRLALPSSRIGIFGGSRGGYDALRALTFPGEVNGIKEDFRFGFGISNFGISNILRAAEGGNISQWYKMLTDGNPKDNPTKWLDRSPETHADLLSVPLLLTHGTNDERVPVIESRAMYTKVKGLGKDVTFLELPDQGHGYQGVDALAKYYQTLLKFLEQLH